MNRKKTIIRVKYLISLTRRTLSMLEYELQTMIEAEEKRD